MSDEHIEKIRSAVEAADHIPGDKKAALSAALSNLNPAIAKVSQTHREDAETVVRLVEVSTHEATRQNRTPERLRAVLQDLKQSVQNFEASHPELVARVTEYSALLAEMGL